MFLQLKKYYKAILGFFPIQLLLIQLKKGHLLLFFWVLLYCFITGLLGEKYGGAYLFLSPEYLDMVNPLSFLLVGSCFGFFTMAFHISSYIHYSFRFQFLATLSRPLYKFSMNNSIIPAIVIATYLKEIIQFEIGLGDLDGVNILFNAASFLIGIVVSIALIFAYFMNTNKSLVEEKLTELKPLKLLVKQHTDFDSLMPDDLYKVKTYMNGLFSINLVRRTAHYDAKFMLETLQQHHKNAALYAIGVFISMVVLSIFRENMIFMIPAAGSILVMFALYLMITGALVSRFKGWTTTVIMIVLLTLNMISGHTRFRDIHAAYGLDYTAEPSEYTYEHLAEITSTENIDADKELMLSVLEKWKAKNMGPNGELPKMLVINTSGGGLRSSLWTLNVMQHAEEITGGKFMNGLHLITGSSGGLLGSSFFREMYLQHSSLLFSDTLRRQVSRDILNPVVFSLVVNDLFISFERWKDKNRSYRKDRGYAFESKFSENTGNVLDKRLIHYKDAELASQIPLTIITPSVLNEGRRLIISPLPMSYMTVYDRDVNNRHNQYYDGIEFTRMFENQDAYNLRFLTALRMSATFPYITPLVRLPSSPPIQVIDAGIRDNTGYEVSLRMLYCFKDWLEANTSGIVFLQINSDRVEDLPIDQTSKFTQIKSALLPVSGAYDGFMNAQQFTQTKLRQMVKEWYSKPVEYLNFSLLQTSETDLALSWHLTEKEKAQINGAIYKPNHQATFERLKRLVNEPSSLVVR